MLIAPSTILRMVHQPPATFFINGSLFKLGHQDPQAIELKEMQSSDEHQSDVLLQASSKLSGTSFSPSYG
jgi:hypothetical protein